LRYETDYYNEFLVPPSTMLTELTHVRWSDRRLRARRAPAIGDAMLDASCPRYTAMSATARRCLPMVAVGVPVSESAAAAACRCGRTIIKTRFRWPVG